MTSATSLASRCSGSVSRRAANGSTPGRLVAIGAFGSLLYSYVTNAFVIVLNPATILYIAVLGLGGCALATGLAAVDQNRVAALANSYGTPTRPFPRSGWRAHPSAG
jgi:hypothetical protein